VSLSVKSPAIHSSRTCSFAALSRLLWTATPQGLAVYQNGVRINEAFGDTVNWSPDSDHRDTVRHGVTNNPAFGLNALGGAVNVQMKNGFNYQAPRSHDGAARSAGSRVRRSGASRSTICRVRGARGIAATPGFAIFLLRTSAASMVTSATRTM